MVVGYPPHCTHALQGLDVVLFARVKVLWGEKLHELDRNEEKVTKTNFLVVYGEVQKGAFTPENVQKGFEATGIHPFNPQVITDDQVAPSLATSTEASAPFALPDTLRDIQEVLRAGKRRMVGAEGVQDVFSTPLHSPNRTATHLTRVVQDTEYTYAADPNNATFSLATAPPQIYISPLHNKHPKHPAYYESLTIDPQLLSPTKLQKEFGALQHRMHYLEGKVDTLETQLLIQDRYCHASNKKLYTHEHKEKTGQQVLADGGKRDMTAPEWIEATRVEEEGRARDEELKRGYRMWWDAELVERRAQNKQIDVEWDTYKKPFQLAKKRPPL